MIIRKHHLFAIFAAAGLMTASSLMTTAAQAGTLTGVDCTENSLILTFNPDLSGGTVDVTKVQLSASADGPFTALSADSSASQEPSRDINITLSDADRIGLGQIAGGSTCHVRVQAGFTSDVTAASTARE